MSLGIEDVERVTELARIAVTPVEQGEALIKLDGIFKRFQELQELDTTDVEPTSGGIILPTNGMRDDNVVPGLNQSEVLANAPMTEGGFIRIRAVFPEVE